DSYYASWGALELGDFEIVKKNLETFLKYEKNGQIHLRVGSSNFGQILKMVGKTPEFGVAYKEDKGWKKAIDPNLLLLITLNQYSEKSKDFELAKNNLSKIKRVLNWTEKWKKDGLIHSGNYA